MLLEDAFIETAQQELIKLISQPTVQSIAQDFGWDNYIAMSLMQKAIRRDDVVNALAGGTFVNGGAILGHSSGGIMRSRAA